MINRILVASVARSDFSITRPVIEKLIMSGKYKVSKIISSTQYLDNENETKYIHTNKSNFFIYNKLKNDNPNQINQVISN